MAELPPLRHNGERREQTLDFKGSHIEKFTLRGVVHGLMLRAKASWGSPFPQFPRGRGSIGLVKQKPKPMLFSGVHTSQFHKANRMVIKDEDYSSFPLAIYFIHDSVYMSRKLSMVLCDNLEGWSWRGGSRGRGYICTYSCLMVLYSRNEHNTVKQLYSK